MKKGKTKLPDHKLRTKAQIRPYRIRNPLPPKLNFSKQVLKPLTNYESKQYRPKNMCHY